MHCTLTIQEEHFNELKNTQNIAVLKCGYAIQRKGRWVEISSDFFLCKEIHPIPEELHEDLSNSIASVVSEKSNNASFIYFPQLSQDLEEEKKVLKQIQVKIGNEIKLGLIGLDEAGKLQGYICNKKDVFLETNKIRIYGSSLQYHYKNRGQDETPESLHRQMLAFGKALIQDLQNLTIGIVGAGATGSAVAMQLTRLGVGKLILIDDDNVDESNLNRLHFSTVKDAKKCLAKVDVIRREIEEIGLGTRVHSIKGWAGSLESKSFLRTCDVVFGCTDDHQGRILLNRLAYFYMIPIFDIGIGLEVSENDPPEIYSLSGRVTYLFPGTTCLICRERISIDRAFVEYLGRKDPIRYKLFIKQNYIKGDNNPSPAVVSYTTETACMAVNEFLSRIVGYRKDELFSERVRQYLINSRDGKNIGEKKENCAICNSKQFWGIGDVTPFLDMIS